MSLREWNRQKLTDWLNHDWPERISGAPDRETPIEGRKLEGRVILRGAAYDSIEAHHQARLLRQEGREVERDYAHSHKVLSYLVDVYMPQAYPHLDNTFKRFFLTEEAVGAVMEIERFEQMAKRGAPLAGALAEEGRWWIERVLDELDRYDYRLYVRRDQRAESRRQARHQDRRSQREIRDEGIRRRFKYYKEETKFDDATIRRRLQKDFAPKGKDELNRESVNAALRGESLEEEAEA